VTFEHCEVDLFFVFSSRILWETKQNKSAKVAIFTEFILGDRQKKTKQDFMKFLFSRLAFSQFHQATGGRVLLGRAKFRPKSSSS
jgi:hypothetical protein